MKYKIIHYYDDFNDEVLEDMVSKGYKIAGFGQQLLATAYNRWAYEYTVIWEKND